MQQNVLFYRFNFEQFEHAFDHFHNVKIAPVQSNVPEFKFRDHVQVVDNVHESFHTFFGPLKVFFSHRFIAHRPIEQCGQIALNRKQWGFEFVRYVSEEFASVIFSHAQGFDFGLLVEREFFNLSGKRRHIGGNGLLSQTFRIEKRNIVVNLFDASVNEMLYAILQHKKRKSRDAKPENQCVNIGNCVDEITERKQQSGRKHRNVERRF